jgi:parallel beta-helix repeat protein
VLTVIAESNAPPENGTTNNIWYIETNDQVYRDDETISTVDIQINSTGAMDWINITCGTTGDITVENGGFLNVTDSTITLQGDFIIKGIVNFDNVTLIMKSTYDGEFEIIVNSIGGFYVKNSIITAFDTWTPIDLDTSVTGIEAHGYHYNFTVNGNLNMSYTDVSYVWGRTVVVSGALQFLGGLSIDPVATCNVNINWSTFTDMEMIGLNLQGRTHNITIENNKIYDIGQSETWYGFGFYVDAFCNATIKNNNITYCSANGIFANTDANCTIIGNDITYNGNMTSWQYRSGVLCWISTPKLIQNNISDNFGVAGVYIISTSSECVLEGIL